jgi:membrane protease YdiL (CAAX protease family)
MNTKQNTTRILIFLALSFGIPWTAVLVISRSTMMIDNPVQAGAIANGLFISVPWLANIATRLITREGWGNLWLKPNFRRSWRFYLTVWLMPFLATVVGGLVFYLMFPQSYDSNLDAVRKLAESVPMAHTTNPWVVLLIMTLSLIFLSVPINTLVSMGEEFGWRAYLLQALMIRFARLDHVDDDLTSSSSTIRNSVDGFYSTGARKAALLTGIIHGVWHLPLILLTSNSPMGINILTAVVYLLFTCSLSLLLSWGTLNSGSVWPAAVGHGAVNASSALPSYLLAGQPITLIGPNPSGLIGGIGYVILALVIFFKKGKQNED